MKLAYRAYDQTGRAVQGTVEGADPLAATEILRGQGLLVTDIGQSLAAVESAPGRTRGTGGVSAKCVAVFTRQLQVLLASGTPLVDALGALIRQTRPGPWQRALEQIRQAVEEGHALTTAMEAYPRIFDEVYRSLIAAGESSGQLPEMLERLATHTQKQMRARNAILGAMIYPTMLVILAVSMLCLMLVFIIPRFAVLFDTMDVPLPGSTRLLVGLSAAFRQWWWLIGLTSAGGIAALFWFLGSAQGRPLRDRVLLRVPVLGRMLKSFATARIVRLLSVLLAGHVPLLKALELIRHCAGNVCYAALIASAQEQVAQGESLHAAFADPELISPSVHEAIRSGERSGRIDDLMASIADFMEDDNETVLRSLTNLIEPIILVVMGILVGCIAVSMFLPLFDLTAMTGGGR